MSDNVKVIDNNTLEITTVGRISKDSLLEQKQMYQNNIDLMTAKIKEIDAKLALFSAIK
jgi:hypothetical protein